MKEHQLRSKVDMIKYLKNCWQSQSAHFTRGIKTSVGFALLIKLLHHKSYYWVSNTAFDAWMRIFAKVLPDGNTLTKSYRKAKAYMKELGLSYDSIHVCPNNCILFRGDYADKDNCPECQASRWKYLERKKSAVKVLRYFPLVPRLKRLFLREKQRRTCSGTS